MPYLNDPAVDFHQKLLDYVEDLVRAYHTFARDEQKPQLIAGESLALCNIYNTASNYCGRNASQALRELGMDAGTVQKISSLTRPGSKLRQPLSDDEFKNVLSVLRTPPEKLRKVVKNPSPPPGGPAL